MELMLGGLLIALSAVLANIADGKNKKSGRNEPKNMTRQYKCGIGFGCLLFFIGLSGLLLGAYSYAIAPRERILVAVLLLGVNIQCRLIVFGERNRATEKCMESEPSNLLEVLSSAFSIGFLPQGSSWAFNLLHLSQIGFVLLIASIFLI